MHFRCMNLLLLPMTRVFNFDHHGGPVHANYTEPKTFVLNTPYHYYNIYHYYYYIYKQTNKQIFISDNNKIHIKS